jgi:hypothetical protein
LDKSFEVWLDGHMTWHFFGESSNLRLVLSYDGKGIMSSVSINMDHAIGGFPLIV